MKGIGVFHHEFAGTHHPKTRADFITEFGLNLIKIKRQLLVAANFRAGNVGNHFFVGRAKAKLAFVPIGNFQHLRTKHRPASRFIPQLAWLHGRHEQFQRTGFVHFLAHYGFNLA